jgi:hypothetical protein
LGRRGSGKTRLLDELRKTVEGEALRIVTVGAEDYKELTYPDILIQILRRFLKDFQTLLRPANWRSSLAGIWNPVAWRRKRRSQRELNDRVEKLAKRLESLLAESEELEAEYQETAASSATAVAKDGLRIEVKPLTISGEETDTVEQKGVHSRKSKQRESKRVKVERLLDDFKDLLEAVAKHLEAEIFLAVDDFYFIRREDQPAVVDYIHRICKDTHAYLKLASIKHRSTLFKQQDVRRGVVRGHEIQPIDLELPLGNFESITKLLRARTCPVFR